MKLLVILAVVISAVFAVDQEEIDRINGAQSSWTAKSNEISEKDHSYRKALLGAILEKPTEYRTDIEINENIPRSFDARKQWHNCKNIGHIRNQGHCGSCWAVAATNAASDRLCIQTHGKVQIDLSAEDLMTCCKECTPPGKRGCDGGYSNRAWNYLKNTGVVTGGDYGSNEGCQPYALPPTSTSNGNLYTPPCYKRCTNKKYRTPFTKDKHYGKTSYAIPANVAAIQSEILKHGPVEAGFDVYSDFFSYTSGVYVRTSDILEGGHAVRVLGWGVEGGVPYWLVANSWGKNWGENGLFKIRRGTNECEFESYMVAGLTRNN